MTHDELLNRLQDHDRYIHNNECFLERSALIAVVELHKPEPPNRDALSVLDACTECIELYPCPTIQAIEKELK